MLRHLKAGDECVLRNRYGASRVKVTKVGSKYLYLSESRRMPFSRDSGEPRDEQNGWGSKVFSVEVHERNERASTARVELSRFGVSLDRRIPDTVLLEIREALLPIIPRTE